MQNHGRDKADWLSALTIIGRIFIFVPIAAGLIQWIIDLTGKSPANNEVIYSGSAMLIICGIVTLVYVAVKRFRKGLRGEE